MHSGIYFSTYIKVPRVQNDDYNGFMFFFPQFFSYDPFSDSDPVLVLHSTTNQELFLNKFRHKRAYEGN